MKPYPCILCEVIAGATIVALPVVLLFIGAAMGY